MNEQKKLKKNHQNLILYITPAVIVILFYLILLIAKRIEPFGSNSIFINDSYRQLYPYLVVFRRKLINGENLFYYWNGGLGRDFLSLYFYYLASPLNLLVVFFPENKVLLYMTFSVILRSSIAAGTFSFYIASKKETKSIVIIGLSVAYALSGFVCAYSCFISWMDTYYIFPVIMVGYDRMKKQNKHLLYVLSLAYMAYTCFYMAFFVGFFLVLKFLLDEHESVKQFFVNSLHFVLSSLIAVLIVATPIMVSFKAALSSGNGSKKFIGISHRWFGNIFEVLRYQFCLAEAHNVSMKYNDSNIYCGVFSITAFLVYICIKNIPIKKKIKKIVLIVFLIISMNETILNYIWHGFHIQRGMPNRFSFLLIFVILELIYEIVVNLNNINEKMLIIACGCSSIYPLVCYFFTDYSGYVSSHLMLAINTGLILIYSGLLIFQKHRINNVFLKYVFTSVFLIEILTNAFVSYSHNLRESDYPFLNSEELKGVVLNTECEADGFYRSDLVEGNSANIDLLIQTNGYSTLDTFLDSDLRWFIDSVTGFTSAVLVENNGLNDLLEDILGLRYIYLPKDNTSYTQKYNYDKVYESNHFVSYENKDSLGLGFAVDKSVEKIEFPNESIFDNMNTLSSKLMNSEKIFAEKNPECLVNSSNCAVSPGDTDYLSLLFSYENPYNCSATIDFEIDESGQYYIYLDSDKTLCANIFVNEIKIKNIFQSSVYYGNFFIGKCNKGDKVKIKIYNSGFEKTESSPYGTREYLTLRIAREDTEAIKRINDYLNDSRFNVTKFSSSDITGEVVINGDNVLMTTIPYSEGWHIYEDGKELMSSKCMNAFLGVELSSGHHKIKFQYISPGFYIGIMISLSTLILYILYCILCRLRENKHKDEKNLLTQSESGESIN